MEMRDKRRVLSHFPGKRRQPSGWDRESSGCVRQKPPSAYGNGKTPGT
jgi:hypothetical protein